MWFKLAIGVACLALASFLITLYGKARYNAGQLSERVQWDHVVLAHEKEIGALSLANERRISAASEANAERLAAIAPVVLRSHDTVVKFAATAAGSVRCLDDERVRGIEADRAALFANYPAPAGTGADALPSDANDRRNSGQR